MKHLSLIALGLFFFAACSDALADEQEELVVGAVSHMTRLDEKDIEIRLRAAQKAGLSAVRWNASWAIVEKEDGTLEIPERWDYLVDTARDFGLSPLIVLGYGNKRYDGGDKPRSREARHAFAKYAAFVAKHFEGRVQYFEMWNEWNIKIGHTSKGSIEDYVELLKVAYPAIKEASPHTTILTGSFADGAHSKVLNVGFGDLFERYLETDAYLYSDAIAIHPYVRRRFPSEFSDTIVSNLYILSRLIRSNPNWATHEMWISELGWTTAMDEKLGVSEKQQAEIAEAALPAAEKFGYSGFIFYELTDDETQKKPYEAHFGIYRNDWSAKPIIGKIRNFTSSE